jgi:hypothetical protein
MLHGAGHRQCEFAHFDLTSDGAIVGAPFDLVYARLLLFHLPQRVQVLRRLWDAVAPGGHLLVQDYDMRTCGVLPALESVDELVRVIIGAFSAAGCDVQTPSGCSSACSARSGRARSHTASPRSDRSTR